MEIGIRTVQVLIIGFKMGDLISEFHVEFRIYRHRVLFARISFGVKRKAQLIRNLHYSRGEVYKFEKLRQQPDDR